MISTVGRGGEEAHLERGYKTNLHYCTTLSERQCDTLFVLKSNSPNSFALSNQLAHKVARLEIPNLDSAVTSSTDNSSVVELQACDAIVMSSKAMDRAHLF